MARLSRDAFWSRETLRIWGSIFPNPHLLTIANVYIVITVYFTINNYKPGYNSAQPYTMAGLSRDAFWNRETL